MNVDSSPIVAIATAPGRGGIGVVRISGKHLGDLPQQLCRLQAGAALTPRHATFTSFVDADGATIDQGLALYFKAPHSYTGEEVLELQGHGGPVVMQMLLARCLQAGAEIGLRLAQPGEFTQRAFLNDKLDLAQAEAVADLIDASTEAAARSASQSLSGAFSNTIHALVGQVTQLRMLVEATLDFPEEEIDFLQSSDACGQLAAIRASLDQVFRQAAQGALLRDGLNIVLAGQPNVGKSSLLNALAGADVAIVTAIAGTTRDKVTETIQLEGIPLNIIDTAGIRDAAEAHDEVERIGIERTWGAVQQADVIVHMLDATRGPTAPDEAITARFPAQIPVLRVWNKIDLSGHRPTIERGESATHIYVSATDQTGMEHLRSELLRLAGWQQTGESLYLARERHLSALAAARRHLDAAAEHAAHDDRALD
ncbi:MAG: tRNA uridine-5-carboxymethylaminomethyl(34) synthesis GTPase MnmE, partial [Pseudomonadota bacterium]|nr:tRNA uridine-5-carboxymethylaminomethyl(34) synthesis GTPase MnmE [Pseudomonadota bacterium]